MSVQSIASKEQEKIKFCSKDFFQGQLTNIVFLICSWAVPWTIVGDACLPGGNLFGVIVLLDCCVVAGKLTGLIPIPKLPPLPPLLGMLLAGFALRNIPVINVAKDIDSTWSSALRSLALTVILVKAGLELDAEALKKMKGVCLRLTGLPCVVEATACAIACNLLLGFPWQWAFLLGFVLGAVTPAVIVPSLLCLQEKGFGTSQGIPTLVIAASSFDDVLAISAFSVILGITFSTVGSATIIATTLSSGNSTLSMNTLDLITAEPPSAQSTGELVLAIFRGPLEMLGGILLGILLGVFLWFIPGPKQKNLSIVRTLLVCCLGILSVFGTRRAGFPGAGALAAIVTAFVAAVRWKETKQAVSQNISLLWLGFEPLLFGLIGAEITVESMDSSTVGLGFAVLFIGLLFRVLATFGAVTFAGLNLREKMFVCFAWLPKATVQAAIGPVALDTARDVNAPDDVIRLAEQVVTIAVLSILLTAPLGAALIGLTGPSLLQREKVCPDSPVKGGSPARFGEDVPLRDRPLAVESPALDEKHSVEIS